MSKKGRTASSKLREQVIGMARRLLEAARETKPPIDLWSLARVQGVVDIREESLGSADAELKPTSDGFLICVNSCVKNLQRRRFSIAHEIAHTFFNPETARHRNSLALRRKRGNLAYRFEETLCNIAAQEMLMPRGLFVKEAHYNPPAINEIERLASLFDTSVEATALRYAMFASNTVQVTLWSHDSGYMEVKWSQGARVCDVEPFAIEQDGSFIERSIMTAYETDKLISELGIDPWRPRWLRIEAKGFGRGANRFVLSLLRAASTVN